MPAAIAVPLIAAAVSGGTAIAAAKIQSNAVKNATNTQAAAGQQALQVQRQALTPALGMVGPTQQPGQFPSNPATQPPVGPVGVPSGQFGTLGDVYGKIASQQIGNLSPYTSLGAGAAGALGFGMGLPAGAPAAAAPVAAPVTPQAPIGAPAGSGLVPVSSAATVPLRAPDGSVKAVPANQVDHYLSMGARRLEQTA